MAQRPPPRPEFARLGRYVLLTELASGGMATIYLAQLEGPEGFRRIVALKRPHPHLARNKAAVTMFLDEARMAARVRHVNVVSTLDVVDEDGKIALVMDYVEGESVSGLMQRASQSDLYVPLGVAARIACDALEGLHAAHEARGDGGRPLGLVHRDVSPHNILVGVDGLARVVDFGIAKAEGRVYQTVGSSVKGKLAYVAPEYLSKGQLDRRSDVYSAAVVLWEMLAGRRLFAARSEREVMARVLGLVVPPLVAVRPAAPPALAEAVARGLSRDPDARFPDAQAMARALRDALPLADNEEVGAWVRSLAAEALAARADALGKARQALAAQGPAARISQAPTSEPTASHRRPVLSLIDLTAPFADDPSAAPRPLAAWRSLRMTATATACAGLVGLSWALLWPRPPSPNTTAISVLTLPSAPAALATSTHVPGAATPAAATPAAASTQAPDAASTRAPDAAPTQAPAASSPPGLPQAPHVEPALPPVSAPDAQPVERPLPASSAGRTRRAPPRVKAKPAAPTSTSCDPPYTYDREGVRHFKPQCL